MTRPTQLLIFSALAVTAGSLAVEFESRAVAQTSPLLASNPTRRPAPSWKNESWLNSDMPLTLEGLKGKVVLLNFWAVNCPPCRIEMPELQKIYRRYTGRGLRVIGVTEMDPVRDQARRFIEESGVTYPILLDPGARIADLYALEAHPTTVVIDARGRVRFVNAGYLKGEEKEIERAVLQALGAGGGR